MIDNKYKIKVIDHHKVDTHIEYIISVEKDGQIFTFSERYSNLNSLNDTLKKFTNNHLFPKFPPKKIFGSAGEAFLSKRQQELNKYFEIISNNSEFASLPPLIKFIEEKRSKNKSKIISTKKQENILDKKNEIKEPNVTSNKDYDKILMEFKDKFYDMNTGYDKEMEKNNDNYIKFFKNNKIICEENKIQLDAGNENNFNLINNNIDIVKDLENKIRGKMEEIKNLNVSIDDLYNTKEILIAI